MTTRLEESYATAVRLNALIRSGVSLRAAFTACYPAETSRTPK